MVQYEELYHTTSRFLFCITDWREEKREHRELHVVQYKELYHTTSRFFFCITDWREENKITRCPPHKKLLQITYNCNANYQEHFFLHNFSEHEPEVSMQQTYNISKSTTASLTLFHFLPLRNQQTKALYFFWNNGERFYIAHAYSNPCFYIWGCISFSL